ncbi:hypothetical protein BX070DRAFT_40057 [Coemansia spiralis]|nr:hypothetical protein BX070DRAFT_40057 [Coemansia spiralis]
MPSKLERPITGGIVTLQDLERRERNDAAPPPTYRQSMHGEPSNRYSGYSRWQTGGFSQNPTPHQAGGRISDSNSGFHNDSHMLNLMAPPNDNNVYPQADPVGPNPANNLGRQSQTVECPWCHYRVNTLVKRRIGFKAGGAAVLIAAIAWPLFWVPLVVPGLHSKTHYCPQCRRKIGKGHRFRR